MSDELSLQTVTHRRSRGARLLPGMLGVLLIAAQAEADDWQDDWALPPGFELSIDVEGFELPSAIAFVPEPGAAPDDPLYFVTELRGALKVVSNDRSVHTFARDFFELVPPEELPSIEGEMGMAGITLDPATGYVFVSFIYQDEARVLRNNIVRFETLPGTFAIKPSGSKAFTEIFARDVSRVAHQIGPMVVRNDALFVSVGDGGQWFQSGREDTTLGKILRMSLDGEALPDNPWYDPQRPSSTRSYLWAKGLRNAFGLAAVGERLYAAENGHKVDRFMEVFRGADYLWDNTDWSIGTNALAVFSPSVGPVQLAWAAADWSAFPDERREQFYLALGGGESEGPGSKGAKAIVTLDHDSQADRLRSPPQHFLRFRGAGLQLPTGVAVGPDGLYVVSLYPLRADAPASAGVLKVSARPGHRHRHILGENLSAEELMISKGCYGCHGRRRVDVNVGPALDPETLIPRIVDALEDPAYRETVAALDQSPQAVHADYAAARAELLSLRGEDAARAWIKYRLLEPQFDREVAVMPKLGLTAAEAESIADFLLEQNTGTVVSGAGGRFKSGLRDALARVWPEVGYAEVVKAFVAGGAGATLLVGLLAVVLARRRAGGKNNGA